MYDTYIFDLYGTLIDIHTDEESPEAWERLAFHYRYGGVEIGAEELRREFGEEVRRQLDAPRIACEHPEFVMAETFEAIARRGGMSPAEGWAEETMRWFRVLTVRKLRLYPGVEETLRKLRAAGKRTYLLSNGQKTFIEMELRALGIDGLFDGIAISSEAGVAKPDPLFYAYLRETYGADLSSAVMIGNDHRTDVEGARRAGIDACYIHSNCSPDAGEADVDCRFKIWDGDFGSVARLLLRA
ncbi:HAD family hydrolase [Cohnella sp. GCM10027633]|uniref:HAD family hydrolase n=1 Tax=unclassified Cohnella TaxID=2636738 RepID=UPI003636EC56